MRPDCVHVFHDTAAFGARLAGALALRRAWVETHRFPDGESRIRIASPPGPHAILVRSLVDPNAKLFELLLAADALRRAGARRVTLVAPYLPYMRQDKVFAPGEAVSQHVVGTLLARTFERVVTVEPHLHRVARLSMVLRRGRSVSAAPAIARWLGHLAPGTVLVGPDEESRPWVRAIARTAAMPFVVAEKTRLSDRRVRVRLPVLASCRRAVLVDDIASSGHTLATAARALRAAGVPRVEAIVVHAIFAPGALTRLRRAGIHRVVSCDTISHHTNAVPTVGLVAAALEARRAARP